jgi:ligand-binding sensor domain-containing protein/signal transduction histidine kinase
MKTLILLVLIVIAEQQVQALDPSKKITQFTRDVWLSDHGLPINAVTSLCQDRAGYIWVGTLEGVARFDGIQFKVFDKSNTPELKNNTVITLCARSNGEVWAGTLGGGVTVFEGKSMRHYSEKDSLPSGFILSIFEDRSGVVWIGSRGGLSKFENGTFRNYTQKDGLPTSQVRTILQGKDQSLWIGTSSGLSRMTLDGRFENILKQNGLLDGNVVSLCEASDGILWIGTQDGGVHWMQEGQITPVKMKQPYVRATKIIEDKDRNIWFSSDGAGLIRYSNKTWQSLTSSNSGIEERMLSVMEDRENNLWVGTNGGGLHRLKEDDLVVFGAPEGLVNDQVTPILEDSKKNLWIGTEDGVSVLSGNELKNYNLKDGLAGNRIRSLCEDRKGRIWIGARNGISIWENGRIKKFTTPLPPNAVILAIHESRDSTIWIGTGGHGVLEIKESATKILTTKDGLKTNIIFSITEDESGKMWFGSNAGVSSYDRKQFRNYTSKEGLGSDIVVSLYAKDQALWIGTYSGGLTRIKDSVISVINTSNGLFSDAVYGMVEDDKGFLWMTCNKGIFKVRTSELDELADRKRNHITCEVYGKSEGMRTVECSGTVQPSGWKGKDGRLWFPTAKGAVMFDPGAHTQDHGETPLVIEKIKIDQDERHVLDKIELSYNKNSFEVHYAALSFRSPERIKFKYKLEGFDKEWHDAGVRRIAYYTKVPPGDYEFRIIASGGNDVWGKESAVLNISIAAPWWQTWWAYSFYGIGIVLAVTAVIQIRIENERKRQEIKKAKELAAINSELQATIRQLRETQAQLVQKEKLASLGQMTAGIAHEINNPLTFVHGNLDYFKKELEKIVEQCRKVVDAGSMEEKQSAIEELGHTVDRLEPEMKAELDSSLSGAKRIKEIVENLRKFARVGESGAKETNIHADLEGVIDLFMNHHSDITIEKFFDKPLFVTGEVSELNQCYLNILTNSVQAIHAAVTTGLLKTGDGHIRISSELVEIEKKKWARIVISDNGIGIPEENKNKIFDPFFTTRAIGQGRGLGLAETYGIIHKHGGTIEVQSEVNKGSSFIITLPQNGLG